MQLGALYLEPGDLLVVLIALLAFAIIVLVCFANKAARDEGFMEGYETCLEDFKATNEAKYDQGYKDGYADASKKVA